MHPLFNKIFKFIFIILALFILGCATAPPGITPERIKTGGIYHRVEKGQTLWAISRIYNIDIDDLIAANSIPTSTKINIGQLIFIPGARQALVVKSDTSFSWPLRGKVISHFMDGAGPLVNKGIDIQAHAGASVVAARSGTISFVNNTLRNYGKTVIIDHGDGLSTIYASNSRILVKVGDCVVKGAPVALVGTNKATGSAQLHFEIRKGHKPKNPLYYLP